MQGACAEDAACLWPMGRAGNSRNHAGYLCRDAVVLTQHIDTQLGDPALQCCWAAWCERQGKVDEALAWYRKAGALGPACRVLAVAGRMEEAVQLAVEGKSPSAAFSLARELEKRGAVGACRCLWVIMDAYQCTVLVSMHPGRSETPLSFTLVPSAPARPSAWPATTASTPSCSTWPCRAAPRSCARLQPISSHVPSWNVLWRCTARRARLPTCCGWRTATTCSRRCRRCWWRSDGSRGRSGTGNSLPVVRIWGVVSMQQEG